MSIIWQIIFYIFILAVPIVAITYNFRSRLKKEKIAFYETKKNVVLSILVPKENDKKPVAAEQMFASLHGIFRSDNRFQDQISFEIVSRDKFIQFYVSMPDYLRDFIEGQIYAQYPNVEIFEVPDYTNEIYYDKSIAYTTIELAKPDVYPIKTFANFEVDPLSAITSVLSKVDESEQIWLQIVIRPVSDAWQIKGISHVAAIRSGKNPSDGGASLIKRMGKFIWKLLVDAFKSFISPSSSSDSGGGAKLSGPMEEAVKEIERKSTKLGFETRIRLLVIGKDKYAARAKLETIVGAFKQFSTTNLNTFVANKIKTNPSVIDTYRKRRFLNEGFVFNIEELASLYHLPTIAVETPNIVWAGSKKGEPPSNLPVAGTVEENDLTLLAKTNFRNNERTFGIKRRDRSLHMYVIGKTGTGKSTLLENMIIDDIKKGQGVAYIDPHGDAIDHIMKYIPPERIDDVIYFNPSDKEWPIGFNPVEAVNPEFKNIVASGVVGIFKKIFGESWGPRLEYILRNALLAAVDYPNSTLLSVMRLLTDEEYRHKVINSINDTVVKDFFLNEYDKYDPKFQREAIAPIQNKVGQFLSSDIIRNIVGQPKSTIDLYDAMNSQKIFLVDLSMGKIGEDNSALLGSMIITKFQLAAMQRAHIPTEDRKDFYLYVDEFQNFATDSFAVILSEARKYRLNLIMTNQYIAQMPEKVAQAIFGNIGTIISFRVGASDAAGLTKEFEPVFSANDLINLNNYNIYVKMAIDGVTRPAFSAVTLNLPQIDETLNKDDVINASRKKYSRPKSEIEAILTEWSEDMEKSRIAEEAKKRAKQQMKFARKSGPNMMNTPVAIPDTRLQNFYSFVDGKGEKWFIPKATIQEEVKEIEKEVKAFEKKEVNTINNINDVSQNNSKNIKQGDKDQKINIEKKSQNNNSKISPIIASELEKDIDKIKNKLNKDKISTDLLVSMEELEEFLSDKNK